MAKRRHSRLNLITKKFFKRPSCSSLMNVTTLVQTLGFGCLRSVKHLSVYPCPVLLTARMDARFFCSVHLDRSSTVFPAKSWLIRGGYPSLTLSSTRLIPDLTKGGQ